MIQIQVVAEDKCGADTAKSLVDRVSVRDVPWIESDSLDDFRTWAEENEDCFMKMSGLRARFKQHGVRAFGHFGGEPRAPDALMHRKILMLLAEHYPATKMVLIARDEDGDTARATGFRQAIGWRKWPFQAILALSRPESEAWILSALEPQTDRQRAKRTELSKELGFDPVRNSERTKSTAKGSPKDTKRVLTEMLGEEDGFERFQNASLDELAKNGEGDGLKAFLEDLGRYIPEVFGARGSEA